MTSPSSAKERPEEIEVKLPCEKLGTIREKLKQQGAILRSARHDEVNDLYDDTRGELSKRGCTLRLRRAEGETILTFKGPARFEEGVKIREEREIRVSDAEETELLLAGIGMRRRFRYEKRREEWELSGCVLALDETPIGRFVEIEGNPAAIRGVLAGLALDFSEAIPYSYASLYARRRKEDPTLPEDMVFADR